MSPKSGAVWEDKEILFDLPFSHLRLRGGERVFDRVEPIEDTKGNAGVKGRLLVTNLRVLWHALASPRINMSLGLDCITSTGTRVVTSGLRGSTQALYLVAGFKGNKYEFIFTNMMPNCVRHYTSVIGVHRAYAASRPYRDLKLRSAVVHNKQLRLLPLEKVCLEEAGVWNLSSDAGAPGRLHVTNVRLVWHADLNESFNVSLPYITIESISIRASKFGQALVVAARAQSGGYVLGFRADPPARLPPLLAELRALHEAYTQHPVFGVEMTWKHEAKKTPSDDLEEFEEIGEPRGEMGSSLYLASQLAQTRDNEPAAPAYSPYLGLAIEPLKEGFTLKSLFEVQTIT